MPVTSLSKVSSEEAHPQQHSIPLDTLSCDSFYGVQTIREDLSGRSGEH